MIKPSKGFRFIPSVSNTGPKTLLRQPLRTHMGLPLWGLFLFGLCFSVPGCFVLATALGFFPLEKHKLHAPLWILFMAGFLFAAVGPVIWSMGWKEFRNRSRLQSWARQHPSQPAMQDYTWDLRGSRSPRWKPFFGALLGAIGMSCFLSIFNWWAFFSKDGPVMVKIIVGIFDLILLFLWWTTLEAFVRALKFGPALLSWAEFPLRPESIGLRWEPGSGLRSWQSATFVLRCIRESHVVVQGNKGRENHVSFEELWSQSDEAGAKSALSMIPAVDLYFNAPPEIPGSCLNQDSPVYWELEVSVEVSGVNFLHRYLVPVYR